MNRREFMTWAGAGLLSTSLPVALAACSSSTTSASYNSSTTSSSSPVSTSSSTLPNPDTAVDGTLRPIASLTDLKPGIPFEGKIDGKPFAISGDPTKPDTIIAVNPTCTHKGCITPWDVKQKQFVCPCHGSSFDDSGKVLQGPADKSLENYVVQVKDGKIFTKA